MSAADSQHRPAAAIPARRAAPRLRRSADAALRRARAYLLGLQADDGHWCGELEGDAILEAEYVMTLTFLGRGGEERVAKAARTLRAGQLPGGGWPLFPGGAADVNPTAKAYFALKLAGDPAAAPHMAAARRAAVELGGIEACNSFTKIYLAIFGQYPWSRCPAVPPELILLPDWMPVNIWEMSAWSRAIVVPLSIVRALRPSCPVPEGAAIPELAIAGGEAAEPAPGSLRAAAWSRFFHLVDAALRIYEERPLPRLRARALARARRWMVRRFEASDGLGAIFPPIVNSILALRALGVAADDPLLAGQVAALDRLAIEEAATLRMQPCRSPVWDTALALNALLDAGLAADSTAAVRATAWLAEREVRGLGDWARGRHDPAPGGWYFEYANEFYPDCDDTAQVVTALSKVAVRDPEDRARVDAALRRGVEWLRGMQNPTGGWAAFDRACDRELLTYVPFADHNAMIDPPTVDVTARVVEALLRAGVAPGSEILSRAVGFLYRQQEQDGSWYGRWGCNYLYGTWLALWALRHAGEPASAPSLRQGGRWLLSRQNRDGGWGELPESYARPETRGEGPSTPSQTAWALLGLMAAGEHRGAAARRGLEYLVDAQEDAGGWTDVFWTGTGFPGVFYLRYHLYATYFPLLALATQRRLEAGEDPFAIPARRRGES
ncbi:MAG: squalene--hopene cyclase [Acidobacteriota bacterium]|nr:squalene--hopene cyclase [Acidobacteriota bacterium]